MNRRRRNYSTEKGFTLVEMVMATLVLSLVMLMGYSMTTKLLKRKIDTEIATNVEIEGFTSISDIDKILAGTLTMRKGLISCNAVSPSIITDTSASYKFEKAASPQGDFSMAFSKSYTLGARDLESTNSVYLSDIAGISEKSVLILIDQKDQKNWGMYQVTSLNTTTKKASLASVSIDETFDDCVVNSSREITQLFLTAGSGASVFYVHNIKFVNFKMNGDDVIESTWPIGSAGEVAKKIGFPGFVSLAMNFNWKPYDAEGRSGIFNYDAKLVINAKNKDGVVKEVNSGVNGSYEILATSKINLGAQTVAKASALTFPTCNTSATLAPESIQPAAPSLQGLRIFEVTGKVSDNNATGTIAADIVPSNADSFLRCIRKSDLNNPHADVFTSLLQINYSAGVYDSYYCAGNGYSTIDSNTSFFDASVGRTQNINCTATYVRAVNDFVFVSGAKPWCKKSNTANPAYYTGKLVEDSGETNPAAGPTLGAYCNLQYEGWSNCSNRPWYYEIWQKKVVKCGNNYTTTYSLLESTLPSTSTAGTSTSGGGGSSAKLSPELMSVAAKATGGDSAAPLRMSMSMGNGNGYGSGGRNFVDETINFLDSSVGTVITVVETISTDGTTTTTESPIVISTEGSSTTAGSTTTEGSSTTAGSTTTEGSSTTVGSTTTEGSSTTAGSTTTNSTTTTTTTVSCNTTYSESTKWYKSKLWAIKLTPSGVKIKDYGKTGEFQVYCN